MDAQSAEIGRRSSLVKTRTRTTGAAQNARATTGDENQYRQSVRGDAERDETFKTKTSIHFGLETD